MGKTITPKYRVEYRDNLENISSAGCFKYWDCTPRRTQIIAWTVKEYGKPNESNLESWRVKMNESFKSGGVNYHLSKFYSVLVYIEEARIIRQNDGAIMATITMPAFEII